MPAHINIHYANKISARAGGRPSERASDHQCG
jgi:hypothetical protein